MTDENDEKGFKVVDKRSLDEDDIEQEVAEAQAAPEQPAQPRRAGGDAPFDPRAPMPKIDFVTFILSLYHSTSCHLGIAPNPDTRTCDEDLPMAKETIDILGMLQDKTQGNLTGEEERILSEILFDLRMAYVRATGGN